MSSALFVILQLVIIVDSSYSLRDYILDNMDKADRDEDTREALLGTGTGSPQGSSMTTTMWKGAYLALVSVGMVLLIVGIPMMYLHYGECDIDVVFISITLLSAIILIVLSGKYKCCVALRANPSASCAPVPSLAKEKAQEQPDMIVNSLIAAFTITWTSWQTSATTTIFLSSSSAHKLPDDNHAGKHDEELASVGLTPGRLASDDSREVAEYQFHVLMVLASLYMAMVLTNWGSFDGSSSSDDAVFSMWVKVISQWVASGLFLWTLVAPAVFPDREFS
uniref:RxLR effector candidate protein n=1 Tax=Hyaloperonospora arabidopsidis (strain Emoy2) TaxID=559515 RepID=M4BDY2_HYAAE